MFQFVKMDEKIFPLMQFREKFFVKIDLKEKCRQNRSALQSEMTGDENKR